MGTRQREENRQTPRRKMGSWLSMRHSGFSRRRRRRRKREILTGYCDFCSRSGRRRKGRYRERKYKKIMRKIRGKGKISTKEGAKEVEKRIIISRMKRGKGRYRENEKKNK